jgi:hypothetical protein
VRAVAVVRPLCWLVRCLKSNLPFYLLSFTLPGKKIPLTIIAFSAAFDNYTFYQLGRF